VETTQKTQVDQKQQNSNSSKVSVNLSPGTTTRSGRQVKKPGRYCRKLDSFPEGSASQEGGSCREVMRAADGGRRD